MLFNSIKEIIQLCLLGFNYEPLTGIIKVRNYRELQLSLLFTVFQDHAYGTALYFCEDVHPFFPRVKAAGGFSSAVLATSV